MGKKTAIHCASFFDNAETTCPDLKTGSNIGLMRGILLFLLVVANVGQAQEPQVTKEALDEQFREKLVAFYHSPDLSKTAAWDLNFQVAGIARSVYSPHPDILRDSAKKSFLTLPEIKQEDIPPTENPIVFPVAELMGADPDKAADAMKAVLTSKQGALVFLNNLDAVSASATAFQMAVGRSQDNEQSSKRFLLAGYARDVYHRLNGDFENPRIAVKSLGEWFIVDLEWKEAGFYIPRRIEWRRRP